MLKTRSFGRPRTAVDCGDYAAFVVAGDSAGANLATVALRSLRGRVAVDLQMLFYPVTDCNPETESYREFGEDYLLTARDMEWFYQHYAPEESWREARISPLRATDLAGLPQTWIATAEYDPLRDEGEAYALRLSEAGVKATVKRYNGMMHGFIRMVNLVDLASQALDEAADVLRGT